MQTAVLDDLNNKTRVLRMSTMVNPHFAPLWNTKCPYILAHGGRGSFKSSVISMKLVTMMKKVIKAGYKANVICVMDNLNHIHDAVYMQIDQALDWLHCGNEFEFYTSPMRIVQKRTGSTFYFYGADDPKKLKSNTIRDIIAVWYEEAANMKGREVFDQGNPTFIRHKSPAVENVKIFYSYNPPRNPYEWINEWVTECENDPEYFVDSSTYLDDELGFTTDQQLRLIEQYKKTDYDYYRWLYLGEVVGLGTNIYNMSQFHRMEHIPDSDHVASLYFSADTGHAVSATAVSAYGILAAPDELGKPRAVLLDTYYYSPEGKVHKKAPSELSPEIHDFVTRIEEQYGLSAWQKTMDSAEAALRNQYFNDFGDEWHPVHKLKKGDMIDNVHSLLARDGFYYLPTPNNLKYFIAQHERYQWDENTLQSDDPKVVKVDDHTCDNFQYFCLDNKADLGLEW
ncbi:terminase [Furfurilactobacillus rossiae]|uniref:PBSX family phage terminase large subunit n=1 Tax=Furfurilactobacillus rossiae TaxID=231049 RepID=UPI001CDC69B7|nr:PBSX family phage terminase large subunit [Furfurilactobacillus rossiae]QLE64001.1 terminase [Furfurilactobacillus rossiae]